MLLIIIALVIILASLAFLIFLVFRHLPDLKNVKVESIIREKQEVTRDKILRARLMRQGEKIREKVGNWLAPVKNSFIGNLKKLKNKAVELEEKYQLGRLGKNKNLNLDELFASAEKLMTEENFIEAEKILIEIITRNKKSVRAYELLGELYFNNKNYNQAEEIYKHLLKSLIVGKKNQKQLANSALKRGQWEELETEVLSALEVDPKVGVYYDDLAQVCEATGKDNQALDCYLKANAIEPNNPKYLDKLIELSVKLGDKGLAKRTFFRLKQSNPENAKLGELKEAIEKM